MASIRRIKRDIDFLANEVISDCYMALYFNDGAKREQIVAVIEEAVEFRNELFVRANHPADKKNKSLVRKHYAQMAPRHDDHAWMRCSRSLAAFANSLKVLRTSVREE